MGQTCSNSCGHVETEKLEMSRRDALDPLMYDLMRKSIEATADTPAVVQPGTSAPSSSNSSSSTVTMSLRRLLPGQHHLLYRNSKPDPSGLVFSKGCEPTKGADPNTWLPKDEPVPCPTRLIVRQHSLRVMEEGGGTHIYALRYPEDTPDRLIAEHATERPESARQEQCPAKPPVPTSHKIVIDKSSNSIGKDASSTRCDSGSIRTPASPKKSSSSSSVEAADIFSATAMASAPRQSVMDWVTISEEHNIHVADAGLTGAQCDYLVSVTEQVCRGQYAAYTYAKQTLGCREYPSLAKTSFAPVHSVTTDILQRLVKEKQKLQLDDREPHIVKYDVTKKERQKLDMHTDKSEWTFLIALSNGCGVDYEGGGTYFECLDATVHIQRGHALVFPGRLRHCGQKITSGLRFLLVGFLVDKSGNSPLHTPNSVLGSSTTTGHHHQHHHHHQNSHHRAIVTSPGFSGAALTVKA